MAYAVWTPILASSPWTRWPASPTRMRREIASCVAGSWPRTSTRALPSSRWRSVLAGRAAQQERPLGVVLRHPGRAGELGAGLLVAAEAGEQVATDARQQVVVGERA